jgi:hypothetical protein
MEARLAHTATVGKRAARKEATKAQRGDTKRKALADQKNGPPKPRAKRNGKKFGLRLYWKSHFDPTKERSATSWHKTETDRDKALSVALKDKRNDGSARYTNIKKVERA